VELKKCDADGSGAISREELELVLGSSSALKVLEKLDIHKGALQELKEMLFASGISEIPIKTVMDAFVLWRGNMPCTVRHVVDMLSFSRCSISDGIKVQIQRSEAHMKFVQVELARMQAGWGAPQMLALPPSEGFPVEPMTPSTPCQTRERI